MAPLKEPPRIDDLERLVEPFREDASMMVQALRDEHMPMKVFETKRSIERQNYLFAKGVTRATSLASPHTWGLAIDMVLDLDHDHWKRKKQHPQAHGGGGAEWDTGVVWNGAVCSIARPEVVAVWKRYGEIATNLGFVWGGKNSGPWQSVRPGDVFGWDPVHVQIGQWRLVAGKLDPPRD